MSDKKILPTQNLGGPEQIIDLLKSQLSSVKTTSELENVKTSFLGRKSPINDLMKEIVKYKEASEKKAFGEKMNELKETVTNLIAKKEYDLKEEEYGVELEKWTDVTAFNSKPNKGTVHPITKAIWEIEDIFKRMGFDIELPYEIDSEDNNFTFVNLPPTHPARSSWDTFYTDDHDVPIVHTSSMQNRIYRTKKLPIYTVVPGKCFRNESTDARHEHTFFQIEGVVVDKGITFTDMMGTLQAFFSEYFGKEVQVMLTPDMFPFVEPGGMISVKWEGQSEAIKRITKGTGWLEIMGCGMIHPNVLTMGGIDPEVYSGFAWGGGIERLIMIKHGVEDVRLFKNGGLKFLRQF
ncbi:MAG: phenylalanine--tRNA ligase subunit alpha [bacterium]